MLITVGVVARNESAHIEALLCSLLALEFDASDYEIIVVDGASTDGTAQLAARTLASGRVQHQVLDETAYGGFGLCFARNLVIERSAKDARFIAFIDADCIAKPDWLRQLHAALQDQPDDVAGAGGPRWIAPTADSKELVINAFLTSRIGSGFNPVFSGGDVTWVRSIANYSALYRKPVLERFRYDESLVVSDDNEINHRITQAGLRFRFAANAGVFHRETCSVRQFAHNMFAYGANIAGSMRKHRSLLRPFVPLSIGLVGYWLTLPGLYLCVGPLALLPAAAYAALGACAVLEVAWTTRSPSALWVLALFPLQHVAYAAGVLSHLLSSRVIRRSNAAQ